MKPIIRILAVVTCVVLALGPVTAQEPGAGLRLPEIQQLYFDALAFRSDSANVTRLDVYVEIPYEALQFIRNDAVFDAQYEVTVTIYDSTDQQVVEKFWREHVQTREYDESISPRVGKLSQKTFLLHPGRYTIGLQILDIETQKTFRSGRKIAVRDFNTGRFGVSDPMLVKRMAQQDGKTIIYPNISGNVADATNSFTVFFESYNPGGADSMSLLAAVRNVRGDIVQRDTSVQPLGSGMKSCFLTIRSQALIAGEYFLDVQATPFAGRVGAQTEENAVSTTRPFVIRWRGVPVSIVDLDAAIDQLQYIAEKEDIDLMKEGTLEEKRAKWRDFWKRRDPTPGSERNELMEEYYARVSYANKNFSHYTEGWKTDMGMVYIMFGSPSNIERHPFDIDAKPYEIWTYYDLDREFVFIDQTGFGDYRLQTPIWDVWRTRPR